MPDVAKMTTGELDFEIAKIMGFDPRLTRTTGVCKVCSPEFDQSLHGEQYSPTSVWEHALPVIQHFKLHVAGRTLEETMRDFLRAYHTERLRISIA